MNNQNLSIKQEGVEEVFVKEEPHFQVENEVKEAKWEDVGHVNLESSVQECKEDFVTPSTSGVKTGEASAYEDCGEGNECKVRWASLRGQYRRYLKKLNTKSGQEAANKPKWRYTDEMSFVRPFLRERDKVTKS